MQVFGGLRHPRSPTKGSTVAQAARAADGARWLYGSDAALRPELSWRISRIGYCLILRPVSSGSAVEPDARQLRRAQAIRAHLEVLHLRSHRLDPDLAHDPDERHQLHDSALGVFICLPAFRRADLLPRALIQQRVERRV